MLMLACVGIGILIGRMTAEKIVVTQDRLPTAADRVDPAVSSSSAKDGGRPSREPERGGGPSEPNFERSGRGVRYGGGGGLRPRF